MYFPIIVAPPFGDTRCRPEGTGGLILKATVRSAKDGVDTFLDGGVQIWKGHRGRVGYFIDSLEFSPYFLTQLPPFSRILEEEIRRKRKCCGSGIRGSSTASAPKGREGEYRRVCAFN
jgi:hypothetical protein